MSYPFLYCKDAKYYFLGALSLWDSFECVICVIINDLVSNESLVVQIRELCGVICALIVLNSEIIFVDESQWNL